MDLDFKEKLARRKQELLAERTPATQEYVSTPAERFEASLHSFIESAKSSAYMIILGAAIFSMVLSVAVFKDWWSFLGSPEYAQYKQRVEREK